MNRSARSATGVAVNSPDQPMPVVRKPGTLDPVEVWLDARNEALLLRPDEVAFPLAPDGESAFTLPRTN